MRGGYTTAGLLIFVLAAGAAWAQADAQGDAIRSVSNRVAVTSLSHGAQLMVQDGFETDFNGATLTARRAINFTATPKTAMQSRYDLESVILEDADGNAPIYMANATLRYDAAGQPSLAGDNVVTAIGKKQVVYSCNGGTVHANQRDTEKSSVCANANTVGQCDPQDHVVLDRTRHACALN